MKPSGVVLGSVDYVSEEQKELNSYTTTHIAPLSEQKEWTEKIIRTREKLNVVRAALFEPVTNDNNPMGFYFLAWWAFLNNLIPLIKVDEFVSSHGGICIRVTMLSQKAVDLCNEMWEKVK